MSQVTHKPLTQATCGSITGQSKAAYSCDVGRPQGNIEVALKTHRGKTLQLHCNMQLRMGAAASRCWARLPCQQQRVRAALCCGFHRLWPA